MSAYTYTHRHTYVYIKLDCSAQHSKLFLNMLENVEWVSLTEILNGISKALFS